MGYGCVVMFLTACENYQPEERLPQVYLAGFESNGLCNVGNLWVNGVPESLTSGPFDAVAYSVCVTGNDIYIAGFESNGVNNIAKYWKNGIAVELTDGTRDTEATYKRLLIACDYGCP